MGGEDGAEVTGSGFECQKGLDWGISVLQSFQLQDSFFGLFLFFGEKICISGNSFSKKSKSCIMTIKNASS